MNRQQYYRSFWCSRKKQDWAVHVVALVLGIRQQLPRLGVRKLYYLLEQPLQKLGVGRDKLYTILRANNLLIKPKRSYRTTTNSKHMFGKHENLVLDVIPTRPEQIWVSDITYIGGRSRSTYLALITDAYSKKIVGYDVSNSLDASGCVRALKMASKGRIYPDKPLIHHSDRGIQYCCDVYQKTLAACKIKVSMTQGYDPYANAVAERVNGILKQEFGLETFDVDRITMTNLVKNSIEKYNTLRPHWSCQMQTPEQMHMQQKIRIKTYRKNPEQTYACSGKIKNYLCNKSVTVF